MNKTLAQYTAEAVEANRNLKNHSVFNSSTDPIRTDSQQPTYTDTAEVNLTTMQQAILEKIVKPSRVELGVVSTCEPNSTIITETKETTMKKLSILLNYTREVNTDKNLEETDDIGYCHKLLERGIVEDIVVWGKPYNVNALLGLERHCSMRGVEILLNNGETPLYKYSYMKVNRMINYELLELRDSIWRLIKENNIPMDRIATIDDYLAANFNIIQEFDIEMTYTPLYVMKKSLYKADSSQLAKWGYSPDHGVFEKKATQATTKYQITLKDKLNVYIQVEYYKANYEQFKDLITSYENSAISASIDMLDNSLTQEERRDIRRGDCEDGIQRVYDNMNYQRSCY